MAAYGTSKCEVTPIYDKPDDACVALEVLLKTFDSTTAKVLGSGIVNVGSGYMGWILGGA